MSDEPLSITVLLDPKFIRKRREALKLTQAAVARAVGQSQTMACKYEAPGPGRLVPVERALQIAELLQADPVKVAPGLRHLNVPALMRRKRPAKKAS